MQMSYGFKLIIVIGSTVYLWNPNPNLTCESWKTILQHLTVKTGKIRVFKSNQLDMKIDTYFMMSARNFAELIPSEMRCSESWQLYLLSWNGYLFSWIQLPWLSAAKSHTENWPLSAYLPSDFKTCKQTQAISSKCQDS